MPMYLSADWQLVSRRSSTSSRGLVKTVRGLFGAAADEDQPLTWTVRHRVSGLVRRLTARTELEASVKIANGLFDAA
jgi:hypothetical protein